MIQGTVKRVSQEIDGPRDRPNLWVFYITTVFRCVDVILDDVTSTSMADELKDKEVKKFFK